MVLESKEKLIASLQGPTTSTVMTPSKVSKLEESLKLQISDLRDANEEAKQELVMAEEKSVKIRESLTDKWEAASREASAQIAQRKAAEAEVRGLRAELREEKDRGRELRAELESARAELARAEQSQVRRAELKESHSETEERLHKLTEALLQKQSALDKGRSTVYQWNASSDFFFCSQFGQGSADAAG